MVIMMKRMLALGVLVLAAAGPAASAYVEKGIILGINLSNLTGKDLGVDWRTKAGFFGGFALTLPLADFFSIQPGIFYSQKGARHEEPFDSGKIRTQMRLSYFDLPVVARIALPLGPEGQYRPYVLGGASYSLKLSSKLQTDYVDYYETPIEEGTLEGLKKSGLNLILGGGFDFAIQNGRLLLEARYSRSLATISAEGQEIRLNVVSILVGFLF
jgi:hypothetical protein